MISADRIEKIKAIVLDIDGVLTDGRVGYDGEREIKFFNTRDGHGIKMAMRAGLKVGLLSGRSCEANRRRAAELGLSFCVEKCLNKRDGFLEILAQQQLAADECLYVGDDVVDIPPMRLAGIAVAVADGEEVLDRVADFRTRRAGGHGAVREVINWLLAEQGKLDAVLERYFNE